MNKALVRHKLSLNPRVLWILGTIFIVALLVFYIFQINAQTKETYLINNYQKQIKEMSARGQKLEIGLAGLSSLQNIEAKIQGMGYKKISQIHYIQALEGPVAARRGAWRYSARQK